MTTAYHFLNVFLEKVGMRPDDPLDIDLPDRDIERLVIELFQQKSSMFSKTLAARESQQQIQHFSRAFDDKYKRAFAYEFSDGDIRVIQQKINELRALITDNAYMDEEFRSRLLKKLEKLQSEFHKRMSDLDRFWGLLGDAGVALGKFGNDAKPFFDRVRELLQITWRTQARAEELATDSPLPELEQEDPM